MSHLETTAYLENLQARLQQVSVVVDPDQLKKEIANLEGIVARQNLWEDKVIAQRVTTDLAHKQNMLTRIAEMGRRLSDVFVLSQLASQEQDLAARAEALDELKHLESMMDSLETEVLLGYQNDSMSAVMTIRSGAGGDDASDFAEMLMRMYLRYAESQSMRTTVIDVSVAEGAGIKSSSIKFEAPYAFGKLSVESGTHRLVRMSPFNSAGKRQTSFAAVEVVPLIEPTEAIEIPESDIRVDVFRSSGPGGQSVNTTDSAVRLTHLPTGTVVSCQNEKSQLQNKLEATRVLQSKLLEMRRQEEEAERKRLAGDVKASWGEQMRSYVLAPYRMVKDLRTQHEENNPDDVFDGKLERFISAGIKWRAQQNS